MRDPKDRSRRLTDGTRWRTFIRLLGLDDLMTSYTSARPGTVILVLDLDLCGPNCWNVRRGGHRALIAPPAGVRPQLLYDFRSKFMPDHVAWHAERLRRDRRWRSIDASSFNWPRR